MNLSRNVKVTQALGYYAAGQTLRLSDAIDMAGFEGCMFIIELGTIISTGVLTAALSECATTGGSYVAAPTAAPSVATVNATTAAYVKSCMVYDVFQPKKQFIKLSVTPSVANAVICGITAIQYNGKVKPSVNDVSVLVSTFQQSPDEA